MKRLGRLPVFLFVLLCVALSVGPHLGSVTATHQGANNASQFDAIPGAVGVAATPGRVFVTIPSCTSTEVRIYDDKQPSPRPFATLAGLCVAGNPGEAYITTARPKGDGPGYPTPTRHGNYFTNYVYVSLGPTIVEISDTGAVLNPSFVTLPADCGADRTGITFDPYGTYGYEMIIACVTGKIYRVTRNSTLPGVGGTGTWTQIADVALALGLASVVIENPDVAPPASSPGFGNFAGQIIVAAPSLDRILAIAPGNGTTGIVTRLDRWRSAEGVNFIPFKRCTFLDTMRTYFTVVQSPASGLGSAGVFSFPLGAFKTVDLSTSAKALVTSGSNAGIGLLFPQGSGTRITQFDNIGSGHEGSAFVDCTVPRLVEVRTDPGNNEQKSINPTSNGTIWFAILSSATFDPTTICVGENPAAPCSGKKSPTYGFTGIENSVDFTSCGYREVNGDGRSDLLCKARIPDLGLNPAGGIYRGVLIAKFEFIDFGGIDPDGEGFN